MSRNHTCRIGAALCAAASLFAASLTGAPTAAAGSDRPAWFGYEREATYGTHVERVDVPMSDGFELGCVLARPAAGSEPATGRFPRILTQYTPYGSAVATGQGPFARYFTGRGYNVMSCDIRGTGISPWDGPQFRLGWPIQARDGYDAVEWLAAQAYSTGNTGASGTSYGGQTSLEVAAQQPPSLRAISPNVAPMDLYREFAYPGGAPGDADWSWVNAPAVDDPTYPERQRETFAAHPLYDSYWDAINGKHIHDDVKVPTLLQGGWFDVFRAGAIDNYLGLDAAGLDNLYLVMGPWVHADSFAQTREPLPIGAQLAWFDHWLLGHERAPLPSGPVTTYEVAGNDGRWVELDGWPASAGGDLMVMGTDGKLDRRPARPGRLPLTINPQDGLATTCLVGCPRPTDAAADNAEPDRQRLTFTSDPLARDAVLMGRSSITLHATLPNTDGNLVAKIMDVSPDGRVTEVAAGWLRASHRYGNDRSVPVHPRRESTFVIETQPTHWRLAVGHRVRVSLTTGDVPRIAADGSSGTIQVRTGARGSFAEIAFSESPRLARQPAAASARGGR